MTAFSTKSVTVGLLSLLLSWHSLLLKAQDCQFRLVGDVFDLSTEEPIPFAAVQVAGTNIGTVADENGHFVLEDLCEVEVDLLCSHVGYKQISHHHDVHHESPIIFLAPEELILESIVIEGKLPTGDLETNTTNKLSTQEFRQVQSESLGDVISQIAGVNTISTGQNIVKPVIHGLHGNRVLIINNGIRHEFQNWGDDHAPEIDPSLVDQVKVIKGAASVRYGPDALGGVVLIDPAPIDLSSHLHGEIRLTGKSNGRAGEGTVKLQKGFKSFALMGQTSYLKQGDLHAPDYNLTNTGKQELSYGMGLRVHPIERLDFSAYYSHFDQELGILRGAVNGNLDDLVQAINAETPNFTQPFSYDINNPKQKVEHDLIKIQGDYHALHQSFSFQYGYQDNRRKEFDVRRGSNNDLPNINLQLLTHSFDADWRHPEIGDITGKMGIQWQKQENHNIGGTNTIPFVPNYRGDRFGLYWIESLSRGNNTFEAGVRFDRLSASIAGRDRRNQVFRNEIDYNNATVTLGFSRKLNGSNVFKTNLGTAWRPPNISELYRFGRHLTFIEYGLWRYEIAEDGQISTATVLTQNERPVPAEVSYKWTSSYEVRTERLSMDLTGYLNYIRNFIFSNPAGVTRTVRGTAPFSLYNQGDALFWGLDVSGRYLHSKKFESTFRGSYLWSKRINPTGFFVGQPPADLNYSLVYRPEIVIFGQTQIRLLLEYRFRQFQAPPVITVEELISAPETGLVFFGNDFDIMEAPPGYLLTHIYWHSTFKRVEINLQLKNLFNTRYRNYTNRLRYFADEPGRNIIFSVAYVL